MAETREAPTVACRVCGVATRMTGTRLCDRCWELESRIKADPELAANILAALAAPLVAPAPPLPPEGWFHGVEIICDRCGTGWSGPIAGGRASFRTCPDCLHTEIAALRAVRPEGPQWQPIESAPMDGTVVLVYGRWGVGVSAWCGDCWEEWEVEPTHWMPLPTPPQEDALSTLSRKNIAGILRVVADHADNRNAVVATLNPLIRRLEAPQEDAHGR